MKYSLLAVVLALAIGLFAGVPVYAQLAVSDMEKELVCQCYCEKVLPSCTCTTANEMRSSIGGMIEEEQSNQQILDYFVAQYGQKVLASSRGSPDSTVFDIPAATTNEGSNPMVWILPLVGIAGGGTALYILRRRAWKGKTGRRKGKAAK